jgi:hypothetical protein
VSHGFFTEFISKLKWKISYKSSKISYINYDQITITI